ncbi:MAG: orotidine-5'-phosphate decarboxylase [Bacteroidetes bacterium]|nr:orotidine-5'-phosphate decarboxylase [Bacteroidota bacterium]
MTRTELFNTIQKKKSFLCVGLDTDITKIPQYLLKTEDPIFEFNKQIIDATKDFAVSFKPNMAFYETQGVKGWISLEKTINYINQTCPDIFTIADAKRGDIGNTSKMYAKAFLETLNFDSITVAPYMGEDSVKPFMEYKNKWVILLALTSNSGASDFQLNVMHSPFEKGARGIDANVPLYANVLETSKSWSSPDNMMYVVGATKAEMLSDIRKIVPDSFLLVPGVGAQGGSLNEVAKHGMNKQCGLLVNSSRGIIYASSGENFAEKAREEAMKLQKEMEVLLAQYL